MTEATKSKRGGPGRGQGRKPENDGGVKTVRPFKMNDGEWEDFKLVTPARVRAWVKVEARKIRKKQLTVIDSGDTIEPQ